MQKLRIRNGFSDVNGINPIPKDIQVDDLLKETRILLFNAINEELDLLVNYLIRREGRDAGDRIANIIATECYCKPNNRDYEYYTIQEWIYETFIDDVYDQVLTLAEYLVILIRKLSLRVKRNYDSTYKNEIEKKINEVLKSEYVGYRIINLQISRITDENEIIELKNAFSTSDNVSEHLAKAQAYLSDKNSIDYENSIKESISAVEAYVSEVLGKSKALGDLLKQFENDGYYIHPALKKAFLELYGYTSDANGIRHAGDIGGPDSTFEEARFMLVSCAAFINYLKQANAKS